MDNQKEGKDQNPSPLFSFKPQLRLFGPYLVFAPSAFFSSGLLSAGAPGAAGAASPPAGAGATAPGSPGAPPAGAAGAAGAGAVFAGSSFFPQPAKAKDTVKRITADHIPTFCTISTHLLSGSPRYRSGWRIYYITPTELQGNWIGFGTSATQPRRAEILTRCSPDSRNKTV